MLTSFKHFFKSAKNYWPSTRRKKMKSLVKKATSLLIATLLAFGVMSGITPAFADEIVATGQHEALAKNNKTATQLDDDLTTNISLSFPGKEDVLAQDIVFVLDKSGASDATGIDAQARQFLDDIKQQADDKGLNIKVGIVNFYYAGKVRQELTDVVNNYDDIQNKLKSSVLGFGTNMHAGLLAAKKMLDEDTAVTAKNKHIILISDGATYLYSKIMITIKPTHVPLIRKNKKIQLNIMISEICKVVFGSIKAANTISRTIGKSLAMVQILYSQRLQLPMVISKN